MFMLGCGEDISIAELVALIGKVVDFKVEIRYDSTNPDGAPRKLLYIDRIIELGWKSSISLEQGIRETYKWFKKSRQHKKIHDYIFLQNVSISEQRIKFREIIYLGYTEAFRALHTGAEHYPFWDYQGRAFESDRGLRIDHFLLSPQATDRLAKCNIDPVPRGWKKASDHTPVICELTD